MKTHPSEHSTLWDAYRQTTYIARTSFGDIQLHPGLPCPELDALLDQLRADQWAYVTACNPGSRLLSSDENVRRQQALLEAVQQRGMTVFEGESVLDPETWPAEPSLLILGLSPDEARSLGRQFDQLAILVGRRGEPAVLVRCEE